MDLLRDILINSKDAMLGGCGGLVAYLYHFSKHKDDQDAEGKLKVRIDILQFLINGVVGGFMAFCLGDVVPDTLPYRDGLVGLVGVVGFGLMGAVESKLVNDLLNRLGVK